MQKFFIAPSILSADFARLGEEVSSVLKDGADIIHIDVMDNHYVPNLTIGPLVCKALRGYGISAPFDVHLMIKPVDRIIPDFAKAGANYISFHPEASEHVDRTIELIKENNCKPGLSFNPSTPLSYLNHIIHKLDMILVMAVNPGFGGQKFIPEIIGKIKQTRALINKVNPSIILAVDGGVNQETISQIAKAGANMFIAGTAIFGEKDRKKAIKNLRDKVIIS